MTKTKRTLSKGEEHETGTEVKVTKADIKNYHKMIETVVKNEKGIIYINDGKMGAGVIRNMNKYEIMTYTFDAFDITKEDLMKYIMVA